MRYCREHRLCRAPPGNMSEVSRATKNRKHIIPWNIKIIERGMKPYRQSPTPSLNGGLHFYLLENKKKQRKPKRKRKKVCSPFCPDPRHVPPPPSPPAPSPTKGNCFRTHLAQPGCESPSLPACLSPTQHPPRSRTASRAVLELRCALNHVGGNQKEAGEMTVGRKTSCTAPLSLLLKTGLRGFRLVISAPRYDLEGGLVGPLKEHTPLILGRMMPWHCLGLSHTLARSNAVHDAPSRTIRMLRHTPA